MKKNISFILVFSIIASFCVINTSAASATTFISIFSNRQGYAGAFFDPPGSSVLYIATTDVAGFEKHRETLRKNEKYAGKALDNIIFIEAKYTEAQMNEIIRKIWQDEDFKVEHSGTRAWCEITIGLVNPPENAEALLRERYDYDKIFVEPIYREYIQPGDKWSKAVQKTESKIRKGANGKNYTGWATSKSTGERYYFKDGKRLTGVHRIGGLNVYFDQNGKRLGSRAVGKDYRVDFGASNNIEINSEKISFDVNFKNIKNRDDLISGTYFELYVYLDDKWEKISFTFSAFTSEGNVVQSDGVMRFSSPLTAYNCEFTPGLYRTKIEITEGRGAERTSRTVVGEFNLI